MDPPGTFYTVTSKEGTKFKVSREALKKCKTLYSSSIESTVIPLSNISGPTLELVFKWCEEHKGEVTPDDDRIPKQVVISDFDQKLMDISDQQLYDLILGAYHLKINDLLNVTCKKVAMMAKGKSPEELRRIFMIPSDEEIAEEEARKAREEEERKRKEAEAKEAVKKVQPAIEDISEEESEED
uniref:Skp1 domain-containing protein n=1 Tax=Caenorhabditis tropicalis TaxID=1561998 RepID=A0A1I7UR15_9PELO